mmetsp:Transcript_8291/g.14581  ORF Transcript_8291/g.14581 Transcript_8291/m.14581 type:complete len:86 (+) Transcript_8291:2220-2477(+)
MDDVLGGLPRMASNLLLEARILVEDDVVAIAGAAAARDELARIASNRFLEDNILVVEADEEASLKSSQLELLPLLQDVNELRRVG